MYRARVRRLVLVMKGWAYVSICHQQKRLLVAGGRAIETLPFFAFRVTSYYVRRGSGQARVYRRRWLSLSSRAKAFPLKGGHRRFVGDSAFHTSLRGASLLVGDQQKWYVSPDFAKSTEFDAT